jgi:hypothetical protein
MKRSTPSGTPNPPNGRRRSTTSWTIPEPADVISYAYLWAREAAAGQEEGLKDRPVVVVVARIVRGDEVELLVAPVTHSQPDRREDGIEMPRSVKRHLGLDSERSWILLTELNRFIWPGPDIRVAPGRDSPLYDAIPEWLFVKVREEIANRARSGHLQMTKRME